MNNLRFSVKLNDLWMMVDEVEESLLDDYQIGVYDKLRKLRHLGTLGEATLVHLTEEEMKLLTEGVEA